MNKSYELRYDPIKRDYLYLHRTTSTTLGSFYHQHEAYELILFLRGHVNLYIENSCYHLQPGDIVVIHPDEMHRAVTLDDTEYERITINLQRSYLERLSTTTTQLFECFDSRTKGTGNIAHLNELQLTQFLRLAGELENVLDSDEYGSDILANSYLAQLLVFTNIVFQQANGTPANIMPPLVRHTMEYIDKHLTQEISLDRLAAAFHMNGTYISRRFKQHTGLTLRSYILGRRIALAKTFLSGGLTVTEACYQSGFSDYANFIRSFTKIVGISPGKYAKKSHAPVIEDRTISLRNKVTPS